jgi:hypothetical protein
MPLKLLLKDLDFFPQNVGMAFDYYNEAEILLTYQVVPVKKGG